jgi:hypothetical protein
VTGVLSPDVLSQDVLSVNLIFSPIVTVDKKIYKKNTVFCTSTFVVGMQFN